MLARDSLEFGEGGIELLLGPMGARDPVQREEVSGIKVEIGSQLAQGLIQQAYMIVDPAQSTMRLLETRLDVDGTLKVPDGFLGSEAVGPSPGEIGARNVGLGEVWI